MLTTEPGGPDIQKGQPEHCHDGIRNEKFKLVRCRESQAEGHRGQEFYGAQNALIHRE